VPARLSRPAGLRPAVPLSAFSSLKVGGPADYFGLARSADQALELWRWAQAEGLTLRWLGGGSNLLIAEAGFRGLVVRFGDDRVEPIADGAVVCAAGASLSGLARQLARGGWSGLEWAATVPGLVGGAVVNNAGAFGSSVAESLAWAELLDRRGRRQRLSPSELAYAYRSSNLKRGELEALVVRAAFRVRAAAAAETVARVAEFQRRRSATQPRQLSAGSVFANPAGDYAGRLIEAAGLKGRRLGDAQISEQHANFIVNLGQARAEQVFELARTAQSEVLVRFGRWLQPELELFGAWSVLQRALLTRAPSGERRL
jgi:UDP-N-acetylmuramate dehydrogenase